MVILHIPLSVNINSMKPLHVRMLGSVTSGVIVTDALPRMACSYETKFFFMPSVVLRCRDAVAGVELGQFQFDLNWDGLLLRVSGLDISGGFLTGSVIPVRHATVGVIADEIEVKYHFFSPDAPIEMVVVKNARLTDGIIEFKNNEIMYFAAHDLNKWETLSPAMVGVSLTRPKSGEVVGRLGFSSNEAMIELRDPLIFSEGGMKTVPYGFVLRSEY